MPEHRVQDVQRLFNALFEQRYRTRLVGGADEPEYKVGMDGAVILYRADYFSSALHEVAHWCIAGNRRRTLPDYGYWYEADGRGADKQREFERVEAKPQALEWLFSKAAGVPFRVSADNLDGDSGVRDEFKHAIRTQANQLRVKPGQRAFAFAHALAEHWQTGGQWREPYHSLPHA